MDWQNGLEFTAQWFVRRSLPHWEQHIKPLAPFSTYLEIGVYEGMSLAYTHRCLLGDESAALAIDSYMPVRDSQKWIKIAEATKNRAIANIEVLKRDSETKTIGLSLKDSNLSLAILAVGGDGVAPLDGQIDLIYIDGGHRADCALLDLCLAWRLLKVGGIMIVDDLHLDSVRRRRHDPKVREAWTAFTSTHLGIAVIYDSGDQVAVKKYRARLPKHPIVNKT